MGSLLSTFTDRVVFSSCATHPKVLLLGLTASGKSSICQVLLGHRAEEVIGHTCPTIGFNVETITHRNVSFSTWDLEGGEEFRKAWRFYYTNTTAVIFVVDSTDEQRIDEAAQVLHELAASDSELHNAIFLIYANKQDLPNAMDRHTLLNRLKLHSLGVGYWHLQLCSALTNEGLKEGIEYLVRNLYVQPPSLSVSARSFPKMA